MTAVQRSTTEPLAYRVRPRTLAEFIGQRDIVGEGTALRAAIESDALSSVILAGPPGTGKTTLAKIIAETTKAQFIQLNAVTSGVADLKAVCMEAERMKMTFKHGSTLLTTGRTVLFIDEIHRFNRAQQDALLPYVERGDVILIGATTGNPYFDVNAALVSRSHVYLLKPLSVEELAVILKSAVADDRGYKGQLKISDEALARLATIANGDARIALNALELSALTAGKNLSLAEIDKLFKERRSRYDADQEDHYDTISAFIKSLRGSDVDAALLWLFKMIKGGEDPRFLFRRMAVFASEDIGNADPRALQMVVSAWQAFELVGFPEGEFFLAQACVYLGQAPKSNAVTRAMGAAKNAINTMPSLEVPMHLRNAPVKGMQSQGYGKGYKYPHNAPGGVVAAHYFPMGVERMDFYEPTDRGFEAEVSERLAKVRKILL